MYLNPKTEYQLRTLRNAASCLGLFVVVSLIFVATPFRGWVEIAAGALITYVMFFYLEQQPIVLRCPRCDKVIATNTPWKCGFCQKENRHADEFPFVHQCEHCSAPPKAYKCHHQHESKPCGQIIFLSADEQESGYASCIVGEQENSAAPVKPASDVRKEAREQIIHDIEMAELQAKLEAIKRRAEFGKPRPHREKVKEAFEKDIDVWMGAEEEAEAQRVIAREKYKDSPEKLQRALDLIDACLNKHTPGTGD